MYSEYIFYDEFDTTNDAIKNLKNFIILAQRKKLNYDYEKIKQLINNINIKNNILQDFDIPTENDNIEIPEGVKRNSERKTKLLKESISKITGNENLDQLDKSQYIYDIINDYNTKDGNKYRNLLDLLKDLDDFQDKNLSVK